MSIDVLSRISELANEWVSETKGRRVLWESTGGNFLSMESKEDGLFLRTRGGGMKLTWADVKSGFARPHAVFCLEVIEKTSGEKYLDAVYYSEEHQV